MKRILLAFVGMSAMAGLGTASAADLSRQQPLYKAPAYVAPVSNWSGFYIGLNGGGGWGTSKWSNPVGSSSFDVSGGMVGGTVGYNWQLGQWVLGLEGDADWANINGSSCINGYCQTKNNFLSTIRGRVGYSFGQWMPYATGGAAIGNIKASWPNYSDVSSTNVGWAAGAGIEYAFAPNWSAKVEYLHVDLGSVDCGFNSSCYFGAGSKVDFNSNLVRGGVNFRF